eukprot:comp21837_c0_seq1/m.49315 comp21837_c0_seq1/g.49315  ORF comp21837_c0_seq1/g.49315 comp21837_c0_seq1/m.49315 type:complete len:357 (+) comp21837_c0_seq1:611-1681(+)
MVKLLKVEVIRVITIDWSKLLASAHHPGRNLARCRVSMQQIAKHRDAILGDPERSAVARTDIRFLGHNAGRHNDRVCVCAKRNDPSIIGPQILCVVEAHARAVCDPIERRHRVVRLKQNVDILSVRKERQTSLGWIGEQLPSNGPGGKHAPAVAVCNLGRDLGIIVAVARPCELGIAECVALVEEHVMHVILGRGSKHGSHGNQMCLLGNLGQLECRAVVQGQLALGHCGIVLEQVNRRRTRGDSKIVRAQCAQIQRMAAVAAVVERHRVLGGRVCGSKGKYELGCARRDRMVLGIACVELARKGNVGLAVALFASNKHRVLRCVNLGHHARGVPVGVAVGEKHLAGTGHPAKHHV